MQRAGGKSRSASLCVAQVAEVAIPVLPHTAFVSAHTWEVSEERKRGERFHPLIKPLACPWISFSPGEVELLILIGWVLKETSPAMREDGSILDFCGALVLNGSLKSVRKNGPL